MNKYISTFLKILKYIGIALVIGYLFIVVKVLDEQKDEDMPITERIANATIGSLYAYIIYISVFISNITDNNNDSANNGRANNNTYAYNIG